MDSSTTTTTDLGFTTAPEIVRSVGFLRDVWLMEDGDFKLKTMDDYVMALEEEKRKIEPFKRELSLCLQVVTDMIEYLKTELMQCRGVIGKKSTRRPVLEDFLPINNGNANIHEEVSVSVGCKRKPEKENGDRNKMDWMSSAQLWSDNYNYSDDAYSCATNKKTEERNGDGDRQSESGNLFGDSKSKNGGGFAAVKGGGGPSGCGIQEDNKKRKVLTTRLPEISLLSSGFRNSGIPEEETYNSSGSSSQGKSTPVVSNQQQLQLQQQPQGPRKARRCWSPELHRRFVSALQQLGGSQAATPKQIRELMKVDGLTNDEVKSHLQKYRLHTRRIGPSSEATAEAVVVLGGGGLWVSSTTPEDHHRQYTRAGSPQSPLHFAVAAAAVARRGMMQGDNCEEEDGRSESYSYKGHNNNAQRSSGEEDVE